MKLDLLGQNDFRGALDKQSETTTLPWNNGAHGLPHRVEGVHPGEDLLGYVITDGLIVLAEGNDEAKKSALSFVTNLHHGLARIDRFLQKNK